MALLTSRPAWALQHTTYETAARTFLEIAQQGNSHSIAPQPLIEKHPSSLQVIETSTQLHRPQGMKEWSFTWLWLVWNFPHSLLFASQTNKDLITFRSRLVFFAIFFFSTFLVKTLFSREKCHPFTSGERLLMEAQRRTFEFLFAVQLAQLNRKPGYLLLSSYIYKGFLFGFFGNVSKYWIGFSMICVYPTWPWTWNSLAAALCQVDHWTAENLRCESHLNLWVDPFLWGNEMFFFHNSWWQIHPNLLGKHASCPGAANHSAKSGNICMNDNEGLGLMKGSTMSQHLHVYFPGNFQLKSYIKLLTCKK